MKYSALVVLAALPALGVLVVPCDGPVSVTEGCGERWSSKPVALAPNRCYAFAFDAKGPATGTVTAGSLDSAFFISPQKHDLFLADDPFEISGVGNCDSGRYGIFSHIHGKRVGIKLIVG